MKEIDAVELAYHRGYSQGSSDSFNKTAHEVIKVLAEKLGEKCNDCGNYFFREYFFCPYCGTEKEKK